MHRAARSMLIAAIVISAASTAHAGTLPLPAGGRTMAGPGAVTMLKTVMVPLITNFFGNDACVTVVNTGSVDVTLDTTGSGTGQAVVAPLLSTTLCQPALTAATLTCSGAQGGLCHATWRMDR